MGLRRRCRRRSRSLRCRRQRCCVCSGLPTRSRRPDCVPVVLRHGPLTMESINIDLVERLPAEVRNAAVQAGLPAGRAWLLVEMGGRRPTVRRQSARRRCSRSCGTPAHRRLRRLVTDPGAQAVLWRCRTDAAGLATRRADGAEAWGGWEDAAVPPERLGDYLRGLDDLLRQIRPVRRVVRALRRGLHAHADRLRPAQPRAVSPSTGSSSSRPPIWWSPSAARCRASTATGGRARNCLARMYGADGLRLFGEMKDIWDPRG